MVRVTFCQPHGARRFTKDQRSLKRWEEQNQEWEQMNRHIASRVSRVGLFDAVCAFVSLIFVPSLSCSLTVTWCIIARNSFASVWRNAICFVKPFRHKSATEMGYSHSLSLSLSLALSSLSLVLFWFHHSPTYLSVCSPD